MKSMAKTLLVLGLLACILHISLADNNTVPSTSETTKPSGQTTKTSVSDVPSIKDMGKVADSSFSASELETPVRWTMNGLYYIWHYLLYDPVALTADVMMEPITLSVDAIEAPIDLIFGPVLTPITNFLSKQYNMTKNIIWWTSLESISYGSGATAETVSAAMQMAFNGIMQFLTDIGLPIANSAEKLATLTDQMATTRSKRSVSNAFGELGKGIFSIIRFPFLLLGSIFSRLYTSLIYLTYIPRLIFGLVKLPFTLLFGSSNIGNATHTLMLTDMNTTTITNMVLDQTWKFMKNTALPELDVVAAQLKENKMVPEVLRNILSEFDSIYRIMKMFGYVK